MRILNQTISESQVDATLLINTDLASDFTNHQFSASEEFCPEMDEQYPALNANDFRYIYANLDELKQDLNVLMNEKVY